MSLVSQTRSTLNPNAPLFVPAAVRQVEDFSPEWWQLVTTSTWFHDYWLSQQQQQGGDDFIENTPADTDIVDMLPDSIDTPDYDLSAFDADFVQFMDSIGLESENTFGAPVYKQRPSNGLEAEVEMLRSLSLSTSTPGSQMEMSVARYPERAVRSFSPRVRSQRIQQPR